MNKYIINHPNGNIDFIQGDGLDHESKTGQTIIYRSKDACSPRDVVAAIAPTSTVIMLEAPTKKEPQREFANINTSKDV